MRRGIWTSAATAAACLAVYVHSLLPGVGYSGDTAKWQFLGQVGGVPHPTGYPLYLTLNNIFVRAVPGGSLAWRANLLSAVLAAVTVVLLLALLRMVGTSLFVASATALTFAFTQTFWTQATVAEVYTLHMALTAGAICCLARWRLGGSSPWLLAGTALVALSFGNHMGTVLLLPGAAWLIWSDRRRAVTWRNGLWVVAVALLGAAQYLYVLRMARVGTYVEQPVTDLGRLLGYVTGGDFKAQMFSFGPGELLTDRLGLSARLLADELLVLLPIAGYGAGRGLRRGPRAGRRAVTGPHDTDVDGVHDVDDVDSDARRAVLLAVGLWGLAAWGFAVNYDIPNVVVFFLPVFFVLAVFLGVGLEGLRAALARAVARRAAAGRPPGPAVARAVGAMALVLLPVVTAGVDYRRASQRGTVTDAERIEGALDAAGRDAVLLTDGYEDSEYFWYFLLGEGLGDDRNLVLAQMVTPGEVTGYLSGESDGPVAHAAARVRSEPGAPASPPLYTATSRQAAALEEGGLDVVQVAPDVWRVGPARGS